MTLVIRTSYYMKIPTRLLSCDNLPLSWVNSINILVKQEEDHLAWQSILDEMKYCIHQISNFHKFTTFIDVFWSNDSYETKLNWKKRRTVHLQFVDFPTFHSTRFYSLFLMRMY